MNKAFIAASLMVCGLMASANIKALADKSPANPPQTKAQIVAAVKRYINWEIGTWNANDRVFAQIRNSIETSIRHGQKAESERFERRADC